MKKRVSEKRYEGLRERIIDPSISPLRKYQDFVIGSSNLMFLLKYEAVTFLFSLIPASPGLILRKIFYPFLFKSTGRNVIFGRNLTIRHPKKITIGNNVVIDDNVVLDAKGQDNKGIIIGDNVIISRNTILSCQEDGSIEIGTGSNISANCLIHSQTSVKIGDYVLMAAYCYIVAGGSHEYERTDIPITQQHSFSKGGVLIEDDVWLGADVKVLDGSKVRKGTIVGAGAVVNGELPPFSVAVGIPAKVIKKRK